MRSLVLRDPAGVTQKAGNRSKRLIGPKCDIFPADTYRLPNWAPPVLAPSLGVLLFQRARNQVSF
jgi:hypothetical protein